MHVAIRHFVNAISGASQVGKGRQAPSLRLTRYVAPQNSVCGATIQPLHVRTFQTKFLFAFFFFLDFRPTIACSSTRLCFQATFSATQARRPGLAGKKRSAQFLLDLDLVARFSQMFAEVGSSQRNVPYIVEELDSCAGGAILEHQERLHTCQENLDDVAISALLPRIFDPTRINVPVRYFGWEACTQEV